MSDTPEQRAAQVCFELGCRPWTPNERRQVVAAAIRDAVQAEREENARLRAAIEAVRMRASYIIGTCRGEREMQQEAEEVLRMLKQNGPAAP